MARPSRHLRNYALAFGLAAFVALTRSPASAEDYPECAKFDNPLAYNQCLAAHGPAAHGTKAIAPPPAGEDGRPSGSAMHGHGGSSMQVSRARNGRMVLEFSIGAAPAATHKHKEMR